MNSDADWLSELAQIYEIDKARQQTSQISQEAANVELTPEQQLQRCRAHKLIRDVQKTLLDGGGKLQFYENVGGYSQAIVLMWTGTISSAAEPANIEAVDGSIIVSANRDGVYVNDMKLAEATPELLKEKLLDVARGFVETRDRPP